MCKKCKRRRRCKKHGRVKKWLKVLGKGVAKGALAVVCRPAKMAIDVVEIAVDVVNGDLASAAVGTIFLGLDVLTVGQASTVAETLEEAGRDISEMVLKDVSKETAQIAAATGSIEVLRQEAKAGAKEATKSIAGMVAEDVGKGVVTDGTHAAAYALLSEYRRELGKVTSAGVLRENGKVLAAQAAKQTTIKTAKELTREVAQDTLREVAESATLEGTNEVLKTGIKGFLGETARSSMTEVEREGAKAVVDCIF